MQLLRNYYGTILGWIKAITHRSSSTKNLAACNLIPSPPKYDLASYTSISKSSQNSEFKGSLPNSEKSFVSIGGWTQENNTILWLKKLFSLEQWAVWLVMVPDVSVLSWPSRPSYRGVFLTFLSGFILLIYCMKECSGSYSHPSFSSNMLFLARISSIAQVGWYVSPVKTLHWNYFLCQSMYLMWLCSRLWVKHNGQEFWISAVIICEFSSSLISSCWLRIAIGKGEVADIFGTSRLSPGQAVALPHALP